MTHKKIDYFFDITFALLLFSLSISVAIPNIILGIISLLFIFKKRGKLFSNNYINLLILFVTYLFIKALFLNSFINNILIYKHLITILISSILIFHVKNIILVIKGYVYGVFLGVLISFGKIFNFYLEYKYFPFGNTSDVENLTLIHRPYLGFMCFIAIVLISFLIAKLEDKNKKLGYLLLTIIFIVFLFTIVARLALFLSLIFITIKISHYFKLSKIKLLITLCSLTIIISSIFLFNKNIKNRFHIKDSYTETIKVLKNQEPRFVIWKCSLNQIYDINFNFFTGYSDRSIIEEKLTSCYGETIENISKRDYYLKTRFNTHNQFFDIFLDGGIIGLGLFLLLFFPPLFYFRNNFEAVFIVLGLITFLVLENLFFRQLGAYLFGILIPLFYHIIMYSKKNEIR